jgi:hypothetical protein
VTRGLKLVIINHSVASPARGVIVALSRSLIISSWLITGKKKRSTGDTRLREDHQAELMPSGGTAKGPSGSIRPWGSELEVVSLLLRS